MSDSTAWQQLLETGTLVQFRVLDTHTESAPDKENVAVRAELIFSGDDEESDPADVAEWGALGFLYTLASLSFIDARPRGYSDTDFLPKDEFTVSDFFECLSFGHEGLHLRTDYVHGRCMKTDITVRPDGTVTLETWDRGQTALRWLDRLQGKKMMGLV
jgi:hypothetical protein